MSIRQKLQHVALVFNFKKIESTGCYVIRLFDLIFNWMHFSKRDLLDNWALLVIIDLRFDDHIVIV